MKVIITGANGKIGQTLFKKLSTKHNVIGIVRSSTESLPKANIRIVSLDNPKSIEAMIRDIRPDAIIHLAAMTGPDCDKSPEQAKKINVDVTELLANLATKYKVKKFIFTSTAAVYNQQKIAATDENHNVNPLSLYGKLKLTAEHALQKVSEASSTQFVVFRMFNVYGPGFHSSLINKLIDSSPQNSVTVLGPTNYWRDYIHIDDIVEALETALVRKLDLQFEVFNLASGNALSNEIVINELRAHGFTPHYTIQSCSDNISWANISRLKDVVGFIPKNKLQLDLYKLPD